MFGYGIFSGLSAISLLALIPLANAQTNSVTRESKYSLSISKHRDVALVSHTVDQILRKASEILRKNDGENDVACNVTFLRVGTVKLFASPQTPGIIENAADRDAVHAEKSFVKVVKDIKFCRDDAPGPTPGQPDPRYDGCAWNPGGTPSIIIREGSNHHHIVWAHVFGHTTGLLHRAGDFNLMTDALLARDHKRLNQCECNSFHSGPIVHAADGPWKCTN